MAPYRRPAELGHALDSAQLGAFLDAAETDRLYAMFCLIAHLGFRRGEAVGLRWAETDLDAGWIAVSNSIVQVGWEPRVVTPKTDSSDAVVRLDQEVTIPALRAWRKQQLEERVSWGGAWTDTGYAFTHEDGRPYHPGYVTGRFERIAFHAGLPPIRLHDLRHGAATPALAAWKDIKVISAMLRHSSHQITADLYASVLPELADEVASAVVSMVPRNAAAGGPSETGGLPSVSHARIRSRARKTP